MRPAAPRLSFPRAVAGAAQTWATAGYVAYAVDHGDHFELVTHGHLAEQGVSADELHRFGLANCAGAATSRSSSTAPCSP